MKKISPVEDFAASILNDKKAIIAWAKREIKCYNELIKLLEKK